MYYYADRYRLEVAAVVEPVPGREPTARYMANVLDAIRKAGVVALFSEPQLDSRAARAIPGEAGLPLYEIDPVGGSPGVATYAKVLDQVSDVLGRCASARRTGRAPAPPSGGSAARTSSTGRSAGSPAARPSGSSWPGLS